MSRQAAIPVEEVVAELAPQRRFRPYPEYRDSGVEWLGEAPTHWKVRKLKYVASLRTSNVDKKSHEGEPPVRLCNYTDVYYNEQITADLAFMEATASLEVIEKFSLMKGDVLITKDSEDPNDIAVPACVVDDLEGVLCGYHLAQIRSNPSLAHGPYLARAFKASGIRDQFSSQATGITRHGLSKDTIGSSLFFIPPPDEQQTIAAFLDRETVRIDELVAKKQRLIKLLAEKRTAIISHAITKGLNLDAPMKDSGIDWLGNVPEHWQLKKVKYLARILRGKFTHRPRNEPRMYDGPYPFIQTGDIVAAKKYIREYRQTLSEEGFRVSKQFPKGTLVMSIAANIGDMAVLDFEACFPDSIVGFIPVGEADLDFLYHLFIAMRQAFLSTATLNTQLNINIERIGALPSVLPPRDEQSLIVEYLDRAAANSQQIEAKIRQAVERLGEYRSTLISAAVTGKIDVRGEI